MPLTLYSLPDGPPSITVRQCLKALNIEYNLVNVDYLKGEHLTEEYKKRNPQKEIPVLDDEGFCLGESNAMLQYLAAKYGKDEKLYPKDLQTRAIVDHRLCFNLSTYYPYVCDHAILPIFFDCPQTPLTLKKVQIALDNLDTYLQRVGKKYAAADHITIADFPLITSTMCLEVIDFDFSPYTALSKWYETYKAEHPELWAIAEEGMKMLQDSAKNPPDFSHLNHPFLRTKKK